MSETPATTTTLIIPWKDRVSLTWGQLALVGVALLVVLGCIFLLASGQWRAAQRLFLRLVRRYREEKIKKLDAKVAANEAEIAKEKGLRERLEAERKALEKQRLDADLKVGGMSHDQVVAELRRRGF